jgi:tRNA G10  N-methylase Trm11
MPLSMIHAHCLDALAEVPELDLIATDPPYAFGGSGDEHALSATVAVALREYAGKLRRGRWMLVMCASSWRSTSYMVEAVRGVVEPVRIAHWNKPVARTKTSTSGWRWASVHVIAFRKGKAADASPSAHLDHITAPLLTTGRRAELPPQVAAWMIEPFAVPGGTMCDPFAGSGALVKAATAAGMEAICIEKNPVDARAA